MKKGLLSFVLILLCLLVCTASASECELTGEHDLTVLFRRDSTCTEDGYLIWGCIRPDCGYTFTEPAASQGHDFENGICVRCGLSALPEETVPVVTTTESPEPDSSSSPAVSPAVTEEITAAPTVIPAFTPEPVVSPEPAGTDEPEATAFTTFTPAPAVPPSSQPTSLPASTAPVTDSPLPPAPSDTPDESGSATPMPDHTEAAASDTPDESGSPTPMPDHTEAAATDVVTAVPPTETPFVPTEIPVLPTESLPSSFPEQESTLTHDVTAVPVIPETTPSPVPVNTEAPSAEPVPTPVPLPVTEIPSATPFLTEAPSIVPSATPVPYVPTDLSASMNDPTPVPAIATEEGSFSAAEATPSATPAETVPDAVVTTVPVSESTPGRKNPPDENTPGQKNSPDDNTPGEPVYELELSFPSSDRNVILLLIVEKPGEESQSKQSEPREYPAVFWLIVGTRAPEPVLQGKCRFEAAVREEKISNEPMEVSLLRFDEPTLLINSVSLSVAFVPDTPEGLDTVAEFFGLDTSSLFSTASSVTGTYFVK